MAFFFYAHKNISSMNKSQQSIVLFSYYVLASGMLLLFFPQLVFQFLIGPIEQEAIFIYHILGLIACCVGMYYWHCGKTNQIEFFKITRYGRTIFFVGTAIIVWLTHAPKPLMAMGLLDLLGAIWTHWALKQDGLLE